jgi:hypothetical protein
MADYPISNVARRVVYTNTGVGPYAFTFEILQNTDIAVYRASTLLTLTTDYTVIINANGTGSVTLVVSGTGNITIVGARAIQRTSDYTTGGDLFASTLNTDLDSQTIYAQQVAESAERGLKAPVTDPTNINMTLPDKVSRAGKTLAFDANGNPAVGEDIGNWRGTWAAGTSYTIRDLVRDPIYTNIYRCNTAHTSSGSAPIDTNADAAKWDLVIDLQNITLLSATTVDATNVEVTNIKAKDGTACATIANTTGALTANNFSSSSATLTGGTINGMAIGASTASTGRFSAVTNTALTSGRVTYAGASGVLQDSANFTFSGTAATLANDATISGLTIGKGAASQATNTAIGSNALRTTPSGPLNTAIGYESLYANTTGAGLNTGIGSYALRFNTLGANNTAVGSSALYSNTTGARNVAIGTYAALANTTASDNIAIGENALESNQTSAYNIAIGTDALSSATAGKNTAIGYESLISNTTAVDNIAIGFRSQYTNTIGNYNVSLGNNTLELNASSSNTAIGHGALGNLGGSSGGNNTAVGKGSLGVSNGGSNTALGTASGTYLSGVKNVAVGENALSSLSCSGDNITTVGYDAGKNISSGSNNACFGYQSGTDAVRNITTGSNEIVVGNNNHTAAYIKVAWTVTSDARDKTSFATVPHGLSFINSLKPVSYKFKKSREDDTPVGVSRYGFKAQDILAVEGDSPIIIDNTDPENLKYNQDSMIPVLVNAINELTEKVKSLEERLKV